MAQGDAVGVNRVGRDPYYAYTGGSVIINPMGETVAAAGEREGWISATLDLGNLRKYREGLPFLADLKPPT